jgi:O-antigen/teichoic acid export membrane protein
MIIKKSFPFAILVMLMAFYNRLDPVMLELILPDKIGNSEAGIYASAYRLMDAGNMIAYLFAVLLLPLFSKMIKQKESVIQIVKLAFTLLIILSTIVALGSHFYSYELMDLLYKNHVDESAAVFRVLMFGFIAISSTYVFGTLLTANGNLKILNIVAASGMILNLTINIVLIPHFYAVGSAYASLITQFATAIAQVWFALRIFKFKPDYRFLLSLLIFVVGVILINKFSKEIFENWMFNFSLMLLASLALAMMLNLLNIKGFIKILKSEEKIKS